MSQTVTPGRIVIFYPNGDENYELPNRMESAPAIVTQVFQTSPSSVKLINATLFLANPGNVPTAQVWSIRPEEEAIEGLPYWAWPQKV